MAARGWYPDPDSTPGRFRFFDGSAWTPYTTYDPRRPPRAADPGARARRVTRRGRATTAAVLAVLLLILAGTVVAVRSRDDRDVVAPRPGRGSPSTFDDSSPTPSASPSGSARAPSTVPSGRPVECDQAKPDELDRPPADGRVHGGPLSFAQLSRPWSIPNPTARFPFSRDSSVQTLILPEDLPWQASAQVGVAAFDDFPGRDQAAETMVTCLLTSDFYTSVDVTLARSTLTRTTIGGVAASRVDALLTFSHPRLKTRGSLIRVIVVDTAPVTYYFHAVPVERQDLVRALNTATDSLSTQ